MTDPPAQVPVPDPPVVPDDPSADHIQSPQEKLLYDALMADDVETVDELRSTAYDADQVPDDGTGFTPRQQFDIDYDFAHFAYQADHEISEDEREQLTVDQVEEENTDAEEAAAAAAQNEEDA
jgi:hypothetical protein